MSIYSPEIDTPTRQYELEKYLHHPISTLGDNPQFVKDVIGTGTDLSNTLVRRWTYMKPKISTEKSTPDTVAIDVIYGFGGRKRLYTIGRDTLIQGEDESPKFSYVINSPDKHLYELEELIERDLKISGYTLPTEIRYTTFSHYLTESNPYHFVLEVTVDTMALFAKFTVNIVLGYIYINDAIKRIIDSEIDPILVTMTPDNIFDLTLHTDDDAKDIPYLTHRYKQYIKYQPTLIESSKKLAKEA